MTNQTSIKCVDLLENGSVDLIFTNYPNSRLGHSFHIRHIKEFHDHFIASRKYYGKLEHTTLSFKDLLGYPILMLGRSSTTSEFVHSMFQQHQLDLVPEIELSSNDLLLDLASIGLGIAFVPDYCVAQRLPDLFPITLQSTLPSRHLAVVHSEQIPVSHAARQFTSDPAAGSRTPAASRKENRFCSIRAVPIPSETASDSCCRQIARPEEG